MPWPVNFPIVRIGSSTRSTPYLITYGEIPLRTRSFNPLSSLLLFFILRLDTSAAFSRMVPENDVSCFALYMAYNILCPLDSVPSFQISCIAALTFGSPRMGQDANSDWLTWYYYFATINLSLRSSLAPGPHWAHNSQLLCVMVSF